MAAIIRQALKTSLRLYPYVFNTSKSKLNVSALYGREFHFRQCSAARYFSAQTQTKESDTTASYGSTEQVKGEAEKREFQAETRMLLDIVAKSLYSNNEVFLRELISNASDALEKLRHAVLSENPNEDVGNLEINISFDKQNRILVIQDNGIGMTKDELISNLGTIARSGSKAFLEELKNKSADVSSIIGQFGVGFYSCFMVANKVEVFTKGRQPDAQGYCWVYDGSGSYEILEAENVSRGTKIVLHLKPECREFADETKIVDVIKKYSNFVNYSILVNKKKTNVIQPLWLMDPKSITEEQHKEFYRFISNCYDNPRFVMHYSTDAPLSIRALLYIPSARPLLHELTPEIGVALYSRRVLIKNKPQEILPKWCNFIKGIVDSEDIPLNLSREMLQTSSLIAKLREVLTSRIIKFFIEKSKKEPAEYEKFYADFHIYIKAGILQASTTEEKENLAQLLRYETSATKPGETKSLTEISQNVPADENNIYYIFANSRVLAESSPYLETLKKKGMEVMFCYETYDEDVLATLKTFKNKTITSGDELLKKGEGKDSDTVESTVPQNDVDALLSWSKEQLKGKAANVKITNKLDTHPCAVTVQDMAYARRLLKMQLINREKVTEEMAFSVLAPCLELNLKHPVIKKLISLSSTNPDLASLVLKQLFYNAMLTADLIQDNSSVLLNINELLTKALEKH